MEITKKQRAAIIDENVDLVCINRNILIQNRKSRKYLLAYAIAGTVLVIIIFAIIFFISKVIIPHEKYVKATILISNKQYSKACQILTGLGHYKDSKEQLMRINPILLKNGQVGDIVFWGEYEQDNDMSNGKETIAWQVLAAEDNKLLLIADDILDVKPYNTENESITWETCSLRSWLNNEFFNSTFSPKEQDVICVTDVINVDNITYKTNGGNNTKDKVFLLSIDEVNSYYINNNQRVAIETKYAKKQGTKSKFYLTGWWLLRSPGYDSTMAAIVGMKSIVGEDGEVWEDGAPILHANAIRPAFWIDISSLILE